MSPALRFCRRQPPTRLLTGGAVLLLALAATGLHGQMEPGAHPVGFRTLLLRDYARAPIPVPGSTNTPTDGRLVPLHLWYPAAPGAGPTLTLADYADLIAQNSNATPPDEVRRAAARQRFLNSVGELGGDRSVAEREAGRILAHAGLAHRDAPAAPGTFPVLLFPEYHAPASNSILAEYLASHGYLVASVPMLAWRSETWPGGSPPNFESYVGDLQFALGALRDVPAADRTRIATIGVGITANAVVALQMRAPLIRAHVSLDGGLISPTEDATLKRTPFFDAAEIRTPMLFIWSPHPNLVPNLAGQYKYAPRLMLHLPGMSEYRYLNYGPLEAVAPGLLGPPPGDTATGYAWAARYVRAFLDAHLRDVATAQRFLAATPEANGAPTGLIQHRLDAALPPPPSPEEVRQLITTKGVGAFTTLYRSLKERDPKPFTMAGLLDLQIWASAAGRDPDASLRKEIALVRLDAFPDSARVHYALANAAAARNETDLARRHFAETLRLLPADPDPSLNDPLRALIRQRTEEATRRLTSP